MMRQIRGIVVVLLVGIALVACGEEESPRVVQVTEADRARTVELRVGDQLEVVLAGNPTTGYQWVRVDDAPVLKTASAPRFSPASSALGAGGTISTLFEATAAGEATLQFQYHRAFEPNVPPLDTFELKVLVQ